jgi:6-phosphogluconolactonase (cycloisomerase 2 family)
MSFNSHSFDRSTKRGPSFAALTGLGRGGLVLAIALLNPACALFQQEEPAAGSSTVTKSYLFMSTYDTASLISQKLQVFGVDRDTGALTLATSVNDLSNAQNPVVLNGYLYIHSRGENKIRVFKIESTTGALTEDTTASGDAVLGIYAGSEFAVDRENNRLAIAYSAGSSGGLKKVRFFQQDPETGVLTQMGSGTDSSDLTSGVPDALAFAQDLSQLFISTDYSPGQLGIGSADIALGTYTSEGFRSLRVGALFAYPGTNFLIASEAAGGIGTYAIPMGLGSSTVAFKGGDLAFYFAKHPSLDVIYAAGSVMGTTAYSFNTTTGALTFLNQAGGAVAVADAYAADGLDVLSNGKFAYASHYDYSDATNTRLDIYPLDATTGAFGVGATEVDLTALQLSATSYPRFLTIADFEVEE